MDCEKALVLSSGGVDSTTCIGIAIEQFGKENIATVSVFYGQRHDKELECARQIAEKMGVPHYELDLSSVFANSSNPLIKSSHVEIVHGSYDEQIKDLNGGPVSTYVPFRNGLMLSAVASLAMTVFPDKKVAVYIGAHADDAAGNAYADCSASFVGAMKRAILIGTYERVRLEAPLVRWNKSQVVKEGLRLGVPYELTWSCYEGGDKPCGKCGTCIDRAKAFADNGVADPALRKEV